MKYKVTLYLLTYVTDINGKTVRRWKKLWSHKFATKKLAIGYVAYMARRRERRLTLQKLGGKNRG